MSYPVPANEARRIDALRRYQLLDTQPEQSFDDFAHLASFICGTPIALITLVDTDRQWFKANVGLDVPETPREQAFCAHTIMGSDLFVVEDASLDTRFRQNPLVISHPHIRFYAGAPLVDAHGFALGSLCVIDREPRHLTETQAAALQRLARQVVSQFELRRISADLAAALSENKTLKTLLPICAHCKSVRDDQGYWNSVEEYLSAQTDAGLSHGICPACIKVHFPDIYEEFAANGTLNAPR